MIYFDNSATSYPKPLSVYLKSIEAQLRYSFNSGRGGYREAIVAGEKIFDTRAKAASLFGAMSNDIIFTKSCTEALNIAIKGVCRENSHILISSLEHNSVSRVVYELSERGVAEYDVFDYSYDTDELLSNIKSKIKENTNILICTHASNVFGNVLPVREIGAICRQEGITFIVDAAQSAGVIDIDIVRDNIDILCCAGHKGLMGNMGTGVLINNNSEITPLLQGGTGSNSFELKQPQDIPEGFEAGTLNNSGIISLGAGIDYITNTGIDNIYKHEMSLISYLYDELSSNEKTTLYTPKPQRYKSVPLISFNYDDYSSEKTASLLAENNVSVRAGFHCSPLAHKHFGTAERGTVRISLGAFNKIEQCTRFLEILDKI